MSITSNLLVEDCNIVENRVLKTIINASNQLKENYSLLEKSICPMRESITYAGLNMSTYCRYTKSLTEFSHDEIVDATKLALVTEKISFEEVKICYKQVEAQDKADQKKEYEERQAKLKIEMEHSNLVCKAFEIVDSIFIGLEAGEERTALANILVDMVDSGETERDIICSWGEEARKNRIERMKASWHESRNDEKEENKQLQAQLEENKIESISNTGNDTNTSTTFRGNPIKWIDKVRYKTFEKNNALEDKIEEHERYNGKNHFIEYDGKQYKQDDFLQTYFERYREIQKRVEFDDDTLKFLACLSTSQCEKMQYHILAQYFDLVEIDMQDNEDLKLFAFQYDSNYKRLYIRLNWENGLNKIVTFGAGLQVPEKPLTEKIYCYQQYFKHDKATFISVNMTWERWSVAIIEEAKRKHIDSAIKAMNYQDKIYMTWTKEERKTIQQWIYNYKSGAIFPFSGEIERGESRTILFDKHCKIIDNIRANETRPQYNKENKVELAAARGKIRHTKSALSDYKKLKGNEWTTAELLTILDNNNKKIKRLVDEGLIERIKRGYYRRKQS